MMCNCKNAKHHNESVDVTLNEHATENNFLLSEDSNDNTDIDRNSDIEDDIGWMFPKVDKDKLIFFASSKVRPTAPVFDTFSLPAKSTKLSVPFLMSFSFLKDCVTSNMSIQ